ncbi:MAG: hypothetical protein AAFN77_23155 [Planctomycetota bacterium]
MKLPITLLALAVTVSIISTETNAQSFDQYGMRANRSQSSQQSATQPKKLFDFSKSESTSKKPFSNLFSRNSSEPFQPFKGMEMPKIQWPKVEMPKIKWPQLQGDGMGKGLFARPSWLPKRDPNAPTFFERMNSKSKAWIDRTTDWAQGKSDDYGQKKTASWNTIREEIERIKQRSALSPATEPPARTAQGSGDRIRY